MLLLPSTVYIVVQSVSDVVEIVKGFNETNRKLQDQEKYLVALLLVVPFFLSRASVEAS
jgi:hypothetical protein